MRQETIGWHQLDHMQIICSLLQTHNHASTSSVNFLQVAPIQNTEGNCSFILTLYYIVVWFINMLNTLLVYKLTSSLLLVMVIVYHGDNVQLRSTVLKVCCSEDPLTLDLILLTTALLTLTLSLTLTFRIVDLWNSGPVLTQCWADCSAKCMPACLPVCVCVCVCNCANCC